MSDSTVVHSLALRRWAKHLGARLKLEPKDVGRVLAYDSCVLIDDGLYLFWRAPGLRLLLRAPQSLGTPLSRGATFFVTPHLQLEPTTDEQGGPDAR